MKLRQLLTRGGIIFSVVLLSGCYYFQDNGVGKTISDLPSAKMLAMGSHIPSVDRDKIEAHYRAALAAAEDPILRRQIMARIADFEMARSEEQQLQATNTAQYLAKPIALYRELIALQEQSPQPTKGVDVNDLRYKLAKALSMDGRNQEAVVELDRLSEAGPASPYLAETQFRRAEKAFSDGDYRAAEQHYKSVAEDNNNVLQQNAIYMQGWAQFKQGDYALCLKTFSQVVDALLGSTATSSEVNDIVKNLPSAAANMLTDTLRVMSLAFSYLDGPRSIASLQKELGARPYQQVFYESLAQLYAEQKRFGDSAATYKYYVALNPLVDIAPQFSIKTIDMYQQGNFPSLVVPAKQDYVKSYGLHSRYWEQRQGMLGEPAMGFLHKSLQELAEYEHAQAQELKQQFASKTLTATAPVQQAYREVANLYREFVSSFPGDAKNPEMTFLLAESLHEVGDLEQAIAAYEQVAYHYKDLQHGADSAYSAFLLAQQLASNSSEKIIWQQRRTELAILFASTYPKDSRVAAVLTQAAQELLHNGKTGEAITLAEQILQLQLPAAVRLQFDAWLIVGHAQFDNKNYLAAENAYRQALGLSSRMTDRGEQALPPSGQIHERIAASIYQQAQSELAQGQKDQAITKLLRVNEVAPGTEVAIKAQYDAGVYLLEQQQWRAAENVYRVFREQYSFHELAATVPAKMVVIYQQQNQWALAADELRTMEQASQDLTVKRPSLYLGAELYEKSGNTVMAIELYQRYANEYPHPVAEAMEAEWHLVQLYAQPHPSAKSSGIHNSDKYQYWLQRVVESHRRAGSAANTRSTYLAAAAASELAQASYKDFFSLPLTLPLKQSLQRKRAALDKALQAQEAVLKYGVGEFTTQASFRIGEIYGQLSRDLLASERPHDLDTLALEQYDLLLEEQAYPFEEKAIQIHQLNSQRSWQGLYDPWVKNSFTALAKLLPARYNKLESRVEVSNEIQ